MPNSWPELLVMALAVWRLSYLVAHERGPFAVLRRFRTLVGAKPVPVDVDNDDIDVLYNDDTILNEDNQYSQGEIAKLVMCIYCNSVWIGILATALNEAVPEIAMLVLLPFALSAVALILQKHMG